MYKHRSQCLLVCSCVRSLLMYLYRILCKIDLENFFLLFIAQHLSLLNLILVMTLILNLIGSPAFKRVNNHIKFTDERCWFFFFLFINHMYKCVLAQIIGKSFALISTVQKKCTYNFFYNQDNQVSSSSIFCPYFCISFIL